jgi:hypothetical protein
MPAIPAGVAQSVEQRTRNAKVAGSIPVSGTMKTEGSASADPLSFRAENSLALLSKPV